MKKKLPSKWCIKVGEFHKSDEIYKWRLTSEYRWAWCDSGYLNETGYHTDIKPVGRIELTLQEFKTLVLKEKPENYLYLIEFFRKLNIS
jgi:hypothetical protein